jgi:2-keto-4-pentenoate hydratase/2-oxohepta-3-ene-1,7-dioic acid hydratase in catechol pathway
VGVKRRNHTPLRCLRYPAIPLQRAYDQHSVRCHRPQLRGSRQETGSPVDPTDLFLPIPLSGPNDPVEAAWLDQARLEIEIAAIIGTRAVVSEADAQPCRRLLHLQRRLEQFPDRTVSPVDQGKSHATFGPVGPWWRPG